MHSRLEPWVHYVPLAPGLADVDEKVKWALDHPDKAERIASASTAFMRQFADGPTERWVETEVVRAYAERVAFSKGR